MDQAQIGQLDTLCEKLFNATNPNERKIAQDALAGLSSVDAVDKCRMILEFSSSPYSQHVAATSLKKAISLNWQALTDIQRQELRKYQMINDTLFIFSCIFKLCKTLPCSKYTFSTNLHRRIFAQLYGIERNKSCKLRHQCSDFSCEWGYQAWVA
jgi:hypothetical protein